MTNLSPPKAEPRPYSQHHHGVTLSDPYHWLRDPGYPQVDDPDILAYLTAENDYFQQVMQPHAGLVDTIFEEIKGRIKEDESSVPIRDGDWLYWWAFKPGAQYRIWYRRPADAYLLAPPLDADGLGRGDSPEKAAAVPTGTPTPTLPLDGEGSPAEIIFDEPAEAEGTEYFKLDAIEVSPDGRLMAVSSDTNGAERFTLRIRDLATGEELETVTDVAIGSPVWSADSSGLVYTEVNDQWRAYRARYHRLGTDASDDVTLYEETEELGFSVGISRAQDRSLIFLSTGDNVTSEIRFVPADNPTVAPVLISPRQAGREYAVDAAHGKLWIRANDEHPNFRLALADPATPAEWHTVMAGSDHVYLRSHTAYQDHLALGTRVDGLDQLILRNYAGDETRIPFAEASYVAGFSGNPELAPDAYRLHYSSMVTPTTIYDYHPGSGELETLKVQQVPSGYDSAQYRTERLMIPARDGKQVPVSVFYRSDFKKDGAGKLFLYAYGAYGISIPPAFSVSRISLADRGWAFAIAHIRGGDDMGYEWYLDGKLEKRTNTFNDFIDAAEGMIEAGFAKAGQIAIQGGSAGGELMGAVANMRPDLWGAVIADVPFVDVLNTMLDDTLPLTPGEWPEWGNPITDKAAFDLIRSYSPYDNVEAKDYPPMLITGGINDPRVTYWEPAKWAAKLRATKTDGNTLLLKINMGAGHGGKSGRWEHIKEIAEAYAFAITQVD